MAHTIREKKKLLARVSRIRGTDDVEFAVLVNDRFQRQGWGTKILGHLIEVARAEGRSAVVCEILLENQGMQRMCRKLGFRLEQNIADGVVRAVFPLVFSESGLPNST